MEMEQLSSDGRSPHRAGVAGDRLDARAVFTAPGGGAPLPRLRRKGRGPGTLRGRSWSRRSTWAARASEKRIQAMVSGQERSRHIPRLQRFPARPRLAEIVAATLGEFGVSDSDIRRRRHIPARLAVAYLARHEGALTLSKFCWPLGFRTGPPLTSRRLPNGFFRRAASSRKASAAFKRRLPKPTDSRT